MGKDRALTLDSCPKKTPCPGHVTASLAVGRAKERAVAGHAWELFPQPCPSLAPLPQLTLTHPSPKESELPGNGIAARGSASLSHSQCLHGGRGEHTLSRGPGKDRSQTGLLGPDACCSRITEPGQQLCSSHTRRPLGNPAIFLTAEHPTLFLPRRGGPLAGRALGPL